VAPAICPSVCHEHARAASVRRAVLRAVIDAIPTDLRVVFVLFELEELTLAQIAAMVGIPIGTAASRLRRARESFHGIVRRMQARQGHRASGGGQ
jgi:RNA polymerase sigma-70 factor (ECF subfamily)